MYNFLIENMFIFYFYKRQPELNIGNHASTTKQYTNYSSICIG